MEIIKIFALSLVFVLVNTTDIPTIADKAGNIEPFVVPSNLTKEYELEYYAQVNWFTAFLSCASRGAKLATITSQEEQTYLEQLLEYYGMESDIFHIAGTDMAQEGRFSWFSIGVVFKFTNWGPNQPDNKDGVQHCVVINHGAIGLWDDRNCLNNFPFICERNI